MIKRILGAAAVAALMASPSQALTTIDLFGDVVAGPFTGTTGSGFVTFNEDLLGVEEDEFLTLSPAVDADFVLEFTIFGQTFTAANDIDFPEFPEVFFELVEVGQFANSDGRQYDMVGIDFVVEEDSETNPTAIDEEGVFSIGLFGDDLGEGFLDGPFLLSLTGQNPQFNGVVVINDIGAAVPVPAMLPIMAGAILVGAFAVRRRQR